MKAAMPPGMSAVAMPIADMVAQMLAASVPHDMIVLAVASVERAAAAATAAGSGGNSADPVAEKRRAYDRERKRKKALSAKTTAASGAVDGCRSTGNSTGISASRALSLSPSSLENKEERETRAREKAVPPEIPPEATATRIADWHPSPDDVRFAVSRNFTSAEIEDVNLKFKIYYEGDARRCEWSKIWPKWIVDERRPASRQRQLPLYATIQGGKDDPRRFSDDDWRRKYAFVAGNPTLKWPEKQWGPAPGNPSCLIPEPLQRELLAAQPMPNRGANQCTAQAR